MFDPNTSVLDLVDMYAPVQEEQDSVLNEPEIIKMFEFEHT